MKKPNFLIAGASKSGSTSLYYILNQHPQVTFSKGNKEPSFFFSEKVKNYIDTDVLDKSGIIYTWNRYLELYKHVKDEIAIGDASVGYLYDFKTSIPNIKRYLGDVKIIILLRNPIEKVLSQYNHIKRYNAEPLSIEEALKAEEERIKANYPAIYHYKNQALYYTQVEAYFNHFSCVKVFLTDELDNRTDDVIKKCCKFLEINEFFIYDSHRQNVSHQSLIKPVFEKYLVFRFMKNMLKVLIGNEYYIKLRNKTQIKHKVEIDSETKFYLKQFYKEDIQKLEILLRKDLRSWKI